MSGGTSAGNIVTESVGVYAARAWRSVVKVDAFGAILDAQLATIIGANWFNNVDDNLAQLNAWLNGTGKAALIKATAAEIDSITLSGDIAVANIVASGNVDCVDLVASGNVDAAHVTAATVVAGTGALSDATAAADDLVVGAIEATDHGVTILSTSVARLAFSDVANTVVGYLAYTHASNTLGFGIAGGTELNLTATTLAPAADGGLALGSGALRYSNAYLSAVTAYSTISLGDGTGSPALTLNRDTAGAAYMYFQSEGVNEWHLKTETGLLKLARYDAGVLIDEVLFGSGNVAFPGELTTAGNIEATGPDVTLTLGDASGNPKLIIAGAPEIEFRDGSWALTHEIVGGSTLNINRYSGGVLQDTLGYGSQGLTVPIALKVGDSATSSPVITLSKSDAGSSSLSFASNNVTRWAFLSDSNEDLLLRRYNSGGVAQSTTTWSNSTGTWSLADSVSLDFASPVLTVGSGAGTPSIVINKLSTSEGSLEYLDGGTMRFSVLLNNAESLLFRRYNSSAVLQDTTTVSGSDGSWSFPKGIGISGSASRFTAGTGAPSGGSNGDLYWRTDGTTSTCLYFRSGGVWTALAT